MERIRSEKVNIASSLCKYLKESNVCLPNWLKIIHRLVVYLILCQSSMQELELVSRSLIVGTLLQTCIGLPNEMYSEMYSKFVSEFVLINWAKSRNWSENDNCYSML